MKTNEWLTLGSHLIFKKNGVMHLTVIFKNNLMP